MSPESRVRSRGRSCRLGRQITGVVLLNGARGRTEVRPYKRGRRLPPDSRSAFLPWVDRADEPLGMDGLMERPWFWIVAWIGFWSLVTFLVYGYDKRAARRSRWRIPEIRLHLLAAIGGLPGALAAQRVFRHKNRKVGFQVVTGVLITLHIIIIIMLFRSDWVY